MFKLYFLKFYAKFQKNQIGPVEVGNNEQYYDNLLKQINKQAMQYKQSNIPCDPFYKFF